MGDDGVMRNACRRIKDVKKNETGGTKCARERNIRRGERDVEESFLAVRSLHTVLDISVAFVTFVRITQLIRITEETKSDRSGE